MNRFQRFGFLPLLATSVVLFIAGCPQSQDQVAANSNQPAGLDQASDPAAANLAPADSGTAASTSDIAPNQAPASYSAQQQPASPPDTGGSYDQASQGSDDPGNGTQPVEYADQPPPPLPDYDQPSAPGDGYLWTPGYWGWGQGGYYWVPGGWVQAPYEGALWTPGYWGYSHNRYGFYRGYWGPHIGYYGGVDYGFGYVGLGYQGGYWGGGHFNYNRSVNNVNVTYVHNVYNRSVNENRGGVRVSFNGGSGGLQVRARPAELAARQEQHAPPMSAQLQNEHAASANRAQFASVNHGRPASLVVNQPLTADRNVRVPPVIEARNQATAQQQQHPMQQQQRPMAPTQQQHQAAPMQQQQQHQNAPMQQQHQSPAMQEQQRQREAPPMQPQHQAVQQQQQHQAVQQQQQHQAVQQQQQRQAVQQQQQRQAASQQQRQAAPQQHRAAPQQQAPPQHKAEDHPKG
jgi:hypothetical protein